MTLFIGFLPEIGFHSIETSVLHSLAYTGGKKKKTNDLQINKTASMFHYTYHKPKTKFMSAKSRICK